MTEEKEKKIMNNIINNNTEKKKKKQNRKQKNQQELEVNGNDQKQKNQQAVEANGNDQKQKNQQAVKVNGDESKRNGEEKTKEEEMKNESRSGVNNKKRKGKEVCPFGNYRSYYGYRIGKDMEEDPRLKVLKKEWFEGKDCLDIGCNSGIVTIQIAKKFNCRKILGIDIDSDRVSDAFWHLRKFARAGAAAKGNNKAAKMEVANDAIGSENSVAPLSIDRNETGTDNLHSEEIDLFDIVSFKKENFVLSWSQPDKQYDTILCLSVTKWIHLNWGDEGLITLFSKIWRLLRPGGIFLLEPQPWRSYENNHLVSETAAMNYRTIKYRPKCFNEILLDKIGFRKVENLSSAVSGSKTGFDRPIFAYHK
ncbi:probable RNA methyltransferase At5g51130 [Mercurialis annua]|uniref:probable RNA methyltransferase At5g51130 n=1 Tax=Mercurialis annua TaxID=3986 RepID=UPI00215E5C4E|nr:probable RNA methyltransferase At5g51130 [Mercurialis annua]